MRIAQTELVIETAPREMREVTREVADWVAGQGMERGLLTVFHPAHFGLAAGSGELLARCEA